MKTTVFDSEVSWLEARRGRITGTKLKEILVKRGTGKKIAFYQLIADRLGIPADDENSMERGHRLEKEAIEVFQKESGKKVETELIICERDDNSSIAFSPDGIVSDEEYIEVKCLSSARHIEALLTQKIPADYIEQSIQPFIVNEKLKILHFVFYDPRLLAKPYFVIEVLREHVQDDMEEYLEYQRATLAEVDKIVNELTF